MVKKWLIPPFLRKYGKTKQFVDSIIEFGIIRYHIRDITTVLIQSGAPENVNQNQNSFMQNMFSLENSVLKLYLFFNY